VEYSWTDGVNKKVYKQPQKTYKQRGETIPKQPPQNTHPKTQDKIIILRLKKGL